MNQCASRPTSISESAMIVLDTNVVSELLRPSPDRTVETWVADRPGSRSVFLGGRRGRNCAMGLRFCRPAVAGMRLPLRLRQFCGRISTNGSCPSTARRRAPMRRLRQLDALPDAQHLRPIARSRPSRGRAGWRWRRATSATLTTWGSNCSIPGQAHDRNGRSLLARHDRLSVHCESNYRLRPRIILIREPGDMTDKHEQRAGRAIDANLEAAGWLVQDFDGFDFSAGETVNALGLTYLT